MPGTPLATGKSIVVFSGRPSKLVYFSPSGRYEKEIAVRAEGQTSLSLIGYQAGRFYFESGSSPGRRAIRASWTIPGRSSP